MPRLASAVLALVIVLSGLVLASPAGAQSADDQTSSGAPAGNDESTSGAPPPAPGPAVRDILFPVVGKANFTDTYGACRSGCTRTHKGVDIFGTKLAPLVAVADGTIVSVRRSALTRAGNMVTIKDDEGWYYLYLHVNNDTPGTDDGANPQGWILPNRLRVGDRVKTGDVIGYLGDSGNAETTPAHLHFEIHQPGVGAINPTPSVKAAREAGRVRPVASLASTPDGRAEHTKTVSTWYRMLLKRDPTHKELFAWTDRFAIGLGDENDLIADITMAPPRRNPTGTVLRTFRVMFNRRPGGDELRQWEARYRAGDRAEAIAAGLLGSVDWTAQGSLDDGQFVDLIYRNARGKAPSASVRRYWLDQLAGGRARASMVANFADSFGVKDATWHELEVMLGFYAALDRQPTDAEMATWRTYLDDGGLLPDMVVVIRGSERPVPNPAAPVPAGR
ncbi:MAG: peptidoglycan DD-metalloendopeptidase family protein [Acidimicrobiia bacterium]|nr:peptidoglycan DD-metalloendopeptidase family protein [Acidimicrobiia bacterium]